MALTQVDPRHRLTLGQRRVDAHVEPLAGAHHLGEQPQLAAGTPALALDAPPGQAGFGHRALDQRVAERLDLGGYRLEERRAFLQRGLAVAVEGRPGEAAGAIDVVGGAAGIGRLQALIGARVDGLNRLAGPSDGLLADE